MIEIFCVIMAGGRGERFWPRSRKSRPKQMLNLLGDEVLLEQTVLRLQGFVPPENILIITNCDYVEDIRQLCSQLPAENIVGEPCGRDTAPCTALAAGIVKAAAKTDDPVMLMLPADHYILNRNAMIRDFTVCCETAVKMDALATIGISPTTPSPEYGYIECGEMLNEEQRIFKVNRFLEKPTVEVAARLLEQGNFKWNSGMFAFPLKTIMRELKKQVPDLEAFADRLASAWGKENFDWVLDEEYGKVRKISIDYAVMEHADSIIVREASFDWDDIGNWTALRNHFPMDEQGNVINESTLLLDSKNCIVFSEDKDSVIAGVDLEDMILIKTSDAILVCPVTSVGKIKKLLAAFSLEDRFSKYL